MSWTNWLINSGIFGVGGFLGGGIIVAIIEALSKRPHNRALTEKERILAEAAKTDTSMELVKLWMVSNQKLVESNNRLEKSNERIQKSYERLQRDMNQTRQVMRSLVGVVERFMPLLRQTLGNEEELELLNQSLAQARALNGWA